MKKATILFILTFFSSVYRLTVYAQDYSDQAKVYFSNYMSSKLMGELIVSSLPTKEDCSLIFKDSSAAIYYKTVQNKKTKFSNEIDKDITFYQGIRVSAFSKQDIQQGNGNYSGGMNDIVDQLKAYATFYRVEFLKDKNDDSGYVYKYWVNINGRWVFFPKPWINLN